MSKRPHICFLQDSLYNPDGGVWTGVHLQTYMLGLGFRKAGFQVSYVVTTLDDSITLPEIYAPFTVEIMRVRDRFPYLRNRTEVLGALQGVAPDYIYTRGRSWLTEIATGYAASASAKTIWASCNEDGCKRWKYTEKAFGSDRTFFRKITRLLAGIPEDILYARGIKRSSHIVNQTKQQQESLKEVFGLHGHVVHSIQEEPDSFPAKDTPPLVLWAGWMAEVKRPEYFMRLAAECSDLDVQLVLAGGASDSLDLAQELEQARKNPRFTYLGRQTREQVLKLMERASLLVNTSSPGGDGIPNVMIEAWYRKVPSLTCQFDPDGLVRANNIGAVTESYEELHDTFRAMIADAALLREMGERAYQTALREFPAATIIRQYLQILGVQPFAYESRIENSQPVAEGQ